MKKYILGSIFLLAMLVVASFAANADTTVKDLSGWAWSSDIGWVSFNSTDSGTGNGGVGTSPVAYGVKFDTTTGNLNGYGWSSNVGWVSFNSSALTQSPACPGSPVSINTTTGNVTGWARVYSGITGYSNGGWDGCIKLSESPLFPTGVSTGDAGVTYVPINATKGSLQGFSWGSDVVGWLKFNPTADINNDVVIDNPPSNSDNLAITANSGLNSTSLSNRTITVVKDSVVNMSWNISNLTGCSTSGPWSNVPGAAASISANTSGSGIFNTSVVGSYTLSIVNCTTTSVPYLPRTDYVVINVTTPVVVGGVCIPPTHAQQCSTGVIYLSTEETPIPEGTPPATLMNSCPTSGYCIYTCESGYQIKGNKCSNSDVVPI